MRIPATETGDSAEFTTFMRAYQDMVFTTAARLTGDDAHAEDIAQEVFVKAYTNFFHLRSSPTAGGWLKTVATNLALNHLTRYRKRWRLFSEFKNDADTQDSELPGPLDVGVPDTLLADLTSDERQAAVTHALRRLPEHQRVPLALFHFDELPYEEIAERLGISLSKVKTDIRRARIALLPLLLAAGVES